MIGFFQTDGGSGCCVCAVAIVASSAHNMCCSLKLKVRCAFDLVIPGLKFFSLLELAEPYVPVVVFVSIAVPKSALFTILNTCAKVHKKKIQISSLTTNI